MKANLRMAVQENIPVEDGWGDGPNSKWKKVTTEWFDIEPLGGEEFLQAQQMKAKTTHKARSHYFPGTNPRMRLVGAGRTFHVESVVNERERNRWLAWRLVEVV